MISQKGLLLRLFVLNLIGDDMQIAIARCQEKLEIHRISQIRNINLGGKKFQIRLDTA